jgi:hypothetical protein
MKRVFLRIPVALAAQLAAESSPPRCQLLLQTAILDALRAVHLHPLRRPLSSGSRQIETGDCDDDIKQAVATKLIALAKAGERNPDVLCEEALKDIRRPQEWAASEAARSFVLQSGQRSFVLQSGQKTQN